MFLTVHRPPQHGLICLLLVLVGCPVLGAPFEIKVHDELIAEYQESAYEIETNLFQAPEMGPSNVIKTYKPAPVAILFPSKATAALPAPNVSPIIPEPATIAKSKAVPINSDK